MSTLRSRLQELAASFADQLMAAIQSTSLQDLVGTKGDGAYVANGRSGRSAQHHAAPEPVAHAPAKTAKKAGRLPRRSADDIQSALTKVVGLLQKHKDGLRAEEIRANLGMQAKEMPRILKEGLSSKLLRSKGQKRATTYFAK
jgi:hypothetical protein